MGSGFDARMLVSMTLSTSNLAKIGIPWRTSGEEAAQNRPKIQNYEDAVREAGAEPVLLPLSDTAGLAGRLEGLDGFVLPVINHMVAAAAATVLNAPSAETLSRRESGGRRWVIWCMQQRRLPAPE